MKSTYNRALPQENHTSSGVYPEPTQTIVRKPHNVGRKHIDTQQGSATERASRSKNMTPNEKNQIIVMLVQSMRGAISDNFRMVTINTERQILEISFFLERDSKIDREEIDDIISNFEVCMMDVNINYTELRSKIHIIPKDQDLPEIQGFRVHQKRDDR